MPVDVEFKKGDLDFRFCDQFDQRAREFEAKVRAGNSLQCTVTDESGTIREINWPNLSFWQSHRYLDHQRGPFYVLQMHNQKTDAHYQIAIRVEISKVSLFQRGIVQKWVLPNLSKASINDQQELVAQLINCCQRYTTLMSIRIQPYMPGRKILANVHEILLQQKFNEVRPEAYIKTRFIDLRPPVAEMLDSFSSNGRVRLKIKDKFAEEARVQNVTEVSAIPFLQKALDDSFMRSVNKNCHYDFKPLFASAAQFCRDVMILGFYLREAWFEPRAFITGIGHSNVVEFSVGGSRSDQRLRKFPFNHVLMWQLALRSKENGSQFLDMGGIPVGEVDALEGITSFKRSFPGFELFVGQEMERTLRPFRHRAYMLLQNLKSMGRRTA